LQSQPKLSLSNNWQVSPLMIADQQQLIDHSERLLAAAIQGVPVATAKLCWSQAEGEGLVLGFSQKPGVLNEVELEGSPLPIYHRRAGGTAVLVGPHLLGLDVFLPAGHPLILADVVESYRWLGETWVDALRLLGVETRAVSPDEAHAQRDLLKHAATREREAILRRACYGALSPYEVVVGQRKVVGLDMIRRRTGSLLQAGLLLRWETERLAMLLGHSLEEQEMLRVGLRERAIGLDELAGRVVGAEEAIWAFEQAMGERIYLKQEGVGQNNVL
jgi:lipoate---protein ligase